MPWQGYVLARIRERASERASQRVFASLMLTNEGYIIIGETAERIPFIDLSRNMQEPFYGFVPLVSVRSHPERCRNRPGRFATYTVVRLRRESHPSPPFRRSTNQNPEDRSLERVRNSRGDRRTMNVGRRSPLETGVKLNLNKLIGAGSGKRALFFLSLTRSLGLFSRAHPTFLQLSRPDSARGGYAHFRLMN